MQGHRVFDGRLLRATLFNREAGKLFVSFRQRVARAGSFSTPEPVQSFVGAGHAHLHIQSRNNDWYNNGETDALCDRLLGITGGYGRVCAMGFSMGGYAALRFSRPLRIHHLIAVSPQFTISPTVLPDDGRYIKYAGDYDDRRGDLVRHGRRALRGVVLVDPFKPLDLLNAGLIQKTFPRLSICRLACSGHPASRVLRAGGHFGALRQGLVSGPVIAAEVIHMHRQSRRASQLYWARLAEVAARHGRGVLASVSAARANELGDAVQGLKTAQSDLTTRC